MKRYQCDGLDSLTPIVAPHGGGVYVLEFRDGTQCVGQTKSFAPRMRQHLHGSEHHRPWKGEVVAVSVMTVPEESMNFWERGLIARKRLEGVTLRNKAHNYDRALDSAFDEFVSVEDQKHWVTGGGSYDPRDFVEAAARTPGPTPKLFTKRDSSQLVYEGKAGSPTRADLIVHTLARIVCIAIPDAVGLEGRYWTISDYPGTAGGRFATLNVGNIELVFFPRKAGYFDDVSGAYCDMVYLNLSRKTIMKMKNGYFWSQPARLHLPSGAEVLGRRAHYSGVTTDCLMTSLLDFDDCIDDVSAALRKLANDLMRRATATKFTRWHSWELTRRVYAEIAS